MGFVRRTSFFTVVVPAYNSTQFINECLESISQQTFADYDVVVVDDGSDDDTGARVADWSNRHPERSLLLCRQPNKGIGAARNAGVLRAQGEFVAFLDADDRWLERKLEQVAGHLARHPELDVVCHDEWCINRTGHRRLLRHGPYTRYEDLLFRGNSLSTSATVVRREPVLAVGGFSEDLRINGAEDYDLWLRLARDGCRFGYLNEVLGIYRVHDGGITGRAVEHARNTMSVIDAHFRALARPGMYQRYLIRRTRAAILRGGSWTLVEQGGYRNAWRLLMKAARENPVSAKTWLLCLLSAVRAARGGRAGRNGR